MKNTEGCKDEYDKFVLIYALCPKTFQKTQEKMTLAARFYYLSDVTSGI